MSLLQTLSEWLHPVLTIYAEGADVVFQSGDKEARGQPLIRIAEDGRIIAFGDEAAAATGGRLVRLFASDSENDDSAIRAFLRYHLALTHRGGLYLRPRVEIIEPTFRRTFGASAAGALMKALESDGFDTELVDAA